MQQRKEKKERKESAFKNKKEKEKQEREWEKKVNEKKNIAIGKIKRNVNTKKKGNWRKRIGKEKQENPKEI